MDGHCVWRHRLPVRHLVEADPRHALVGTSHFLAGSSRFAGSLNCLPLFRSVVPVVAISARSYGMKLRKLSQQTQESLARATEVAEVR